MDKKKTNVILLLISIISFFLMSAAFLIMPLDNMVESLNNSKVAVISGICFWSFLAIGAAAQIILSLKLKKGSEGKAEKKHRVGVFAIASNKVALIADIASIASLIGFIISAVVTHATGYVCYIFIALFVFAFCMHCILNGKNYYRLIHGDNSLKNKRSGAKDINKQKEGNNDEKSH